MTITNTQNIPQPTVDFILLHKDVAADRYRANPNSQPLWEAYKWWIRLQFDLGVETDRDPSSWLAYA